MSLHFVPQVSEFMHTILKSHKAKAHSLGQWQGYCGSVRGRTDGKLSERDVSALLFILILTVSVIVLQLAKIALHGAFHLWAFSTVELSRTLSFFAVAHTFLFYE